MLTLLEKIELVSSRYEAEELCSILEIDSLTLLTAFNEELEDRWDKFSDIELDISEGC